MYVDKTWRRQLEQLRDGRTPRRTLKVMRAAGVLELVVLAVLLVLGAAAGHALEHAVCTRAPVCCEAARAEGR